MSRNSGGSFARSLGAEFLTELSAASLVQGSSTSFTRRDARRSSARSSSTYPSVKASWKRTRGLGSAPNASTASFRVAEAASLDSASRSACSRTPGSASFRAVATTASSSAPSPSRVQSAWKRASGDVDSFASFLSASTADLSWRSIRSRCAVERHHPFGFSKWATSSGADWVDIFGRAAGGAPSAETR